MSPTAQRLTVDVLASRPATECVHCRRAVPRSREGSEFCCPGCEAVHGILVSRGLDRYYRLRDAAGEEFHPPRPSPERVSYAYLDEEKARAAFTDSTGTRMEFYLPEARCAACVWLTENLPNVAPGVSRARMNLARSVAEVEILPGGSFARAAEMLEALGYRPEPVHRDPERQADRLAARQDLRRIGVTAVAAGNIMILTVALYGGASGAFEKYFAYVAAALYLPVILYGAAPFFVSAWNAIRRRDVSSIDVPISIGVGTASVVSFANAFRGSGEVFFDSLAGLIFLLLVSRYVLRRVQARALEATRAVHFLTPARALRKDPDGQWREVDSGALVPGDVVLVRPRELFPADGVVLEGNSELSQSWLTGESRAVPVRPGERVCAGAWNISAAVEVQVERAGHETRLGGILRTLEATLRDRSPTLRQLDRVGRAFALLTLPLIATGFAVGYFAQGWEEGLARALAVAIVLCPCAFAFGVPLALSRALANLAREGILVKGASVLEEVRSIRRIIFDKTGTLTEGKLEVLKWSPDRPRLERILLGLEQYSTHPVAEAVRREFADRFRAAPMTDIRENAGFGVKGQLNGSQYALSGGMVAERDAEGSVISRVVLRENGVPVGELILGDRPRPGAAEAVSALKTRGYEIEILSGDGETTVRALARAVGIDAHRAQAGFTPEAKAEYVRAAPDALMVGDGANDALALAEARVGLAVQGGMEVAMRAADAFSFAGGPETALRLIAESDRAFARIRGILTFTVFYNVVVVSVALLGWLTPLFAAIVMPISAFAVTGLVFWGGRR